MENAKQFFCWIRLVDLSSKITPTPAPPPTKHPITAPAPPPPNALSLSAAAGDIESSPTPPPVHSAFVAPLQKTFGSPTPPPIHQANAQGPVGAWSASQSMWGRDGADTAFDYGPAFLDEEAAMSWLADTKLGKRWDSESLNRFLMTFTYYPEDKGDTK
jgi:hypothetical protein